MIKKVLYYREIGEAPKLRAINNKAKENRDSIRLKLATDYLAECLKNPVYIQNYENKLKRRA